jgi:formylglycine-generating enzyme required for sulfatase activity
MAQETNQLQIISKPVLIENEIISSANKDSNGEVCAGLIVIHDMEGLTYDSYNKIVKITSNPGRDLLFISTTEQVVTIFKSGYQPLKLVFNELGIKLKSGEVWQIKVTGDKKTNLLPINFIITDKKEKPIKDATIIIDGLDKSTEKTPLLNIGKHNLVIQKTGYRALNTEITVTEKDVLFSFTLTAIELMVVEIISEPNEAAIYIDGVNEGVTNLPVFRYPSIYKLRLSKSGYLDIEKEIEVKEGSENKFTFNLVKNISSLRLTVTPADAEVEINNKSYGQSRNIEMAPGSHLLVIKKTGYREVRETINLLLNQPLSKTIGLEPIIGNLQIRILPMEAEGKLLKDGKEIARWNGAKIIKDLIIGSYTLEARLDGYERITKEINITEDKTIIEDIKLNSVVVSKPAMASKIDNMVYVEGGEFMMGSESGSSDEKPVHKVVVKSFYIDKYEVTQSEYEKVMGNNPSYFKNPSAPVEQVSWNDAVAYAQKIGKRLPTEAEWEYAARGGNKSKGYKYSGSNSIGDVAWYDSNSSSKTRPVGTKEPNELGIYDMSGNVWEWCSDWYSDTYYSSSPLTNPTGPSSGTYRVLRGGSWVTDDIYCRVAFRVRSYPTYRLYSVGFRCVQDK